MTRTKLRGTAVRGIPFVKDVDGIACKRTASELNMSSGDRKSGRKRQSEEWRDQEHRTADEEPKVGKAAKLLKQTERYKGEHIVPKDGTRKS